MNLENRYSRCFILKSNFVLSEISNFFANMLVGKIYATYDQILKFIFSVTATAYIWDIHSPSFSLSHAQNLMAATSDAVGDVTPNGSVESLQSALIFLGTGCSSAVPNAMCLIQPSDPPCPVCSQSLSLPPERNPNYRFSFSFFFEIITGFLWIPVSTFSVIYHEFEKILKEIVRNIHLQNYVEKNDADWIW